MPNEILDAQLAKVLTVLLAAAQPSDPASAHAKGLVREAFVQLYLRRVLPVSLRISSGDVIDALGHCTGHCDLVIESRFAPTVPNPVGTDDTLHLSEGVACVIEVKSSLHLQWDEVVKKAEQVRKLERSITGAAVGGQVDYSRVPMYVVAYHGWQTQQRVRECVDAGTVDGVLVLQPAYFYGKMTQHPSAKDWATRHTWEHAGPAALWEFAWALFHEVSSVDSIGVYREQYIAPYKSSAPAS